jgi:hypothetical protein
MLRHIDNYEYNWYFGSNIKTPNLYSAEQISHTYVWECYVYNYFLEEKLVYFHQYALNASFHQFLDPFINNDYENLCIWIPLKLLKNCPHKKLSARKKQVLALDCTGGQCYFNILEVFDSEQSRICHLNTKNLLLYQGTFFHLYTTSKHICTQ